MRVSIKAGKNDEWGYVESFQQYNYDNKGTIKVLVSVNPEGRVAKPYAYRGGEFISLSQIEAEMGIEKYLKAKKPIYCKLSDGFLVSIKAGIDYKTLEYLPEKSSFSVYKVGEASIGIEKGYIDFVRIVEIPETLSTLMNEVSKNIIKCGGDRLLFLKSRL